MNRFGSNADVARFRVMLNQTLVKRCGFIVKLKKREQFICKVTTDTDDACKLVEVDLTYVTDEYNEGRKIFKKPHSL